MSRARDWFEAKAAGTSNSGQVEQTLRALAEQCGGAVDDLRRLIEEFPLGEKSLLHLISISSVCATRLVRDPEILPWLLHPDVCASPRGRNRMIRDLRAMTTGSISQQNFRQLRLWKGRETLRIALREIAGAAALEETTAELSQLAEICVQEVLQHWDKELRHRFGAPQAELAVLALGKLGGRELNHSSDIDVIFLYGEEGQITPTLTYHQWFDRLATKVFETFAANDPAGPLFRMDLRLRPEGSAGPMARSLDSLENYYAGFGETWERLALVKARFIAGNEELAYEFLRQHQPFIYPRSPTPELLDEIAAIKRRIEREVVGHEKLGRNVKLGTGGIREIEFVVQALQLLHGARNAFLQETSTLKALPALAELDLLPREEVAALEAAYRFLRRVEHRLQIEAEQQTHTIPDEPEALAGLSRSLGFAAPEEFSAALHHHTQCVRTIFKRVVADRPRDQETGGAKLDLFANQQSAEKALAELGRGRGSFHVAPRTRQIFRKLRPMLLQWLSDCADPDTTLTHFVRFVEAYGMRSLLFELLVANPRLLELVVKTLDASRFATDVLLRRPQILEEVTASGVLDRSVSVDRHLKNLRSTEAAAGKLDPVRAYRQGQWLRILVRDVLGAADLAVVCREHSALAEACLLFVHSLVAPQGDLTIVALGKFGGRDLSYGADLDVVFVGENTRAAQELVVEMAKSTGEGMISPLDVRLRPDGEKGPLTGPLSACETYYYARAQLWELQALSRARPLCGSLGAEYLQVAQRAWRMAGARQDLFVQIDAMRERIRQERGSGSEILDFKTGYGGIVEAEFLVQALQMRAGAWAPQFSAALEELKRLHALTPADAGALQSSYEFLRRCESVLRRSQNMPVSSLPLEEAAQRKFAKCLGAKNLAAFGDHYRAARETIHAIYSRYFEKLI